MPESTMTRQEFERLMARERARLIGPVHTITVTYEYSEYQMEQVLELLCRFLADFACVFDADWDHTRAMLQEEEGRYIAHEGSFLCPRVSDESTNWGNRGALLDTYRQLAQALQFVPNTSAESYVVKRPARVISEEER